MIYAAIPTLALWLAADLGSASAGLDLGYMQMYDLQFTAAHKTFADYAQIHPEDPLAGLSPREMEVFSYLVNGLRAKDIADLLEISPKTVDTYRASLMRKLNVHDLVGLVKFAIERNLTTTSAQR